MRRRAWAIGVLAALFACGSAEGATLDVRVGAGAGPVFAGEAVVWGEERADGSAAVLRRWVPGGQVQTLHRIVAEPRRGDTLHVVGFGNVSGSVAASPSRIAWAELEMWWREVRPGRFGFPRFGSASSGLTADGDEPAALVPGCSFGSDVGVAVDGDAVAILADGYVRCDGRRSRARVWIVDGDAPPRVIRRTAGTRIGMVRLAGPWVAWWEAKRIVVAERATGRIVERIGQAPSWGPMGPFDVDADGTLAMTTCRGRCETFAVEVLQPGDGRRVRLAPRTTGPVTISEGRAAFVEVSPRGRERVVVAATDGTIARRFARVPRGERVVGEVALDGGRVAWATAPATDDPGDDRGTLHVHVVPPAR